MLGANCDTCLEYHCAFGQYGQAVRTLHGSKSLAYLEGQCWFRIIQAGFRKKDQQPTIPTIIRKHSARFQPENFVVAAFLNVEKAFYCVWLNGLRFRFSRFFLQRGIRLQHCDYAFIRNSLAEKNYEISRFFLMIIWLILKGFSYIYSLGQMDHKIPCNNPELLDDDILMYLGKAIGHCMIISPGCIVPGLASCTAMALFGIPITGNDITIHDVSNPDLWPILEIVMNVRNLQIIYFCKFCYISWNLVLLTLCQK